MNENLEYNKKSIYIIDGFSIFFRSYYGMPKFVSKNNTPIGAIYGFLKTVFNLIKETPEYIIIALDSGGRTFRDDIYDKFLEEKMIKSIFNAKQEFFQKFNLSINEVLTDDIDILQNKLQISNQQIDDFCSQFNGKFSISSKRLILLLILANISFDNVQITEYQSQYKANRQEIPDDFRQQFAILQEFLDISQIPYLKYNNYEADDIIASCIKQANLANLQSKIISSDKDLLCLVSDNVKMYDISKKQILDSQSVMDKFLVNPAQMMDYLSLVGDSADNIPGVPQIGPKMAVKLLQEFQNINNILENLDKIPPTAKKNILENLDLLKLSQNLVQLDFSIPIDIKDLKFQFNSNQIATFCKKYEINISIPKFKDINTDNHQQKDLFSYG